MSNTQVNFEVSLTLDVPEGYTPEQARKEMAALFTEYLTNPDNPFLSDYGEDAWGGYDGPVAGRIRVEEK